MMIFSNPGLATIMLLHLLSENRCIEQQLHWKLSYVYGMPFQIIRDDISMTIS